MQSTPSVSSTDTKPHYELLDGLRGVAALAVIWYHVFEAFATSPVDQKFNHGYLAVDFFFVLSGFVLGYAYDDRWRKGMTSGKFMLRRIIRLQPMVVVGVLFGVVAFIVQGCEKWDGSAVSISAVVLSLVLGLFMLPSLPGTLPEVRGNGEMFPLNGPSWSLFFEYIGSVLYALVLHRLSNRALKCVVLLSGICLALGAVMNISGDYHLGVGWSAGGLGFLGGFLRLAFSFSIGLYMSRVFEPVKIRGAFWICSAVIIGVFCVPYITADGQASVMNGIFDAVCTLAVFPMVVYLGASGFTSDKTSGRICEFFGNISYPVYIIHYPAMYLFYWWVWSNGYTFGQVWYVAAGIFIGVILLAWILLRVYDMPVRRYLTSRLCRK